MNRRDFNLFLRYSIVGTVTFRTEHVLFFVMVTVFLGISAFLLSENKTLSEKLISTESEINSLNNANTNLAAQNRVKEQEVDALSSDKENLRHELNQTKEELAKTDKELEMAKGDIERKTLAVEETRESVNEL